MTYRKRQYLLEIVDDGELLWGLDEASVIMQCYSE
jgi:hypothetical protein